MELIDGKYKQEELLGTGAFSEVWKVTYVQTGVTLAMKIYKPNASMDNDGVKMLTHEYALMVNLNHRNLLKPQFFDVYDGRPYLILPFCEKGNINNMIGKLTEDEAWKLLRDTASALDYLHTRKPPIIHQDIKPANILVADDGTYMLTDFGVSTSLKATLSRLSIDEESLLSAGTLAYMDPMKFSRKNLPIMANDIWSLGATVFEMLTGELPFGNSGGLLQKKGADVPDIPDNFSVHLNDILRSCMDEDPAKRPWASKLHEIAREAILHPEVRNKKISEEGQVNNVKPASDNNIQPGVEPISRTAPDPDMGKTQLINNHAPLSDSQPPIADSGSYSSSLSTTASSDSSKSLVWPWIVAGIIGGTLVGVMLAYFI